MPKVTITGKKGLVQSSGTGLTIATTIDAHSVYAVDYYNNMVPCPAFGLAAQWNTNFGGLLAGEGQTVSALNILTPAKDAFLLSKALEPLANLANPPGAAHAATVFGGSGVAGADVSLGTNASPGVTPTVTQRISRLTGNVPASGITMTAGADMTAAADQTLLLFTGNTFVASQALTLTLAPGNALTAAYGEAWESDSGTDVLTRSAAPTDADTTIIFTDSGSGCTILAGSYVYLFANTAGGDVAVKTVIRTTGGTIATTFG